MAHAVGAPGQQITKLQLIFEDIEPDDGAGLLIHSTKSSPVVVIAERHSKRGDVMERSARLIEALPETMHLFQGEEKATLLSLISLLDRCENGVVVIDIYAPSPTLQSLIELTPVLLAQKVQRIVWYGGFTSRIPLDEKGKATSEIPVSYTTYNLSSNPAATRAIFGFAQINKIPTFLLGADNLRLNRSLNLEVPVKLAACGTEATRMLCDEIEEWNGTWVKDNASAGAKLEKVAAATGASMASIQASSMTPGDSIAAIVSTHFDQLQIRSTGIANVQLTGNFRFEVDKKGNARETRHRQVTFAENDASSVRLVNSFHLNGADSTDTFRMLLDQSLQDHMTAAAQHVLQDPVERKVD